LRIRDGAEAKREMKVLVKLPDTRKLIGMDEFQRGFSNELVGFKACSIVKRIHWSSGWDDVPRSSVTESVI